MTPKEKQEEFDKVQKVLNEAYKNGLFDEVLDSILDEIFKDVMDLPSEHLGTFVEIKSAPAPSVKEKSLAYSVSHYCNIRRDYNENEGK